MIDQLVAVLVPALIGALIAGSASICVQVLAQRQQIQLKRLEFAHQFAERKLDSLKSAYRETLDAASSFYTAIRLCQHDDSYEGMLNELLEDHIWEMDPNRDPSDSSQSKEVRIMEWTPILDQARDRYQRSIAPLILEHPNTDVIRVHALLSEDFDGLVSAMQDVMMHSGGADEDEAETYEHKVRYEIEALKQAIQKDLDRAEHAVQVAPTSPTPIHQGKRLSVRDLAQAIKPRA